MLMIDGRFVGDVGEARHHVMLGIVVERARQKTLGHILLLLPW